MVNLIPASDSVPNFVVPLTWTLSGDAAYSGTYRLTDGYKVTAELTMPLQTTTGTFGTCVEYRKE